jgi:RNA polymerase sigma factor (sigma-70 family)
LYERYAGPIFGFCLKRLGTREEAEDALQTTFLNAQQGLRRGVVPQFEAAWLYKIAENVCNSRHDRARRRPEAVRDLDAMQDVLAAPEPAEPDVIAALPDAIARMPATQRRALLLREWQGLSYREIAEELGITEAAVETLLYRARRSLMANLERPERRGRLSRIDLGSVVAFLKSFLSGSAAKLVVAGVAVTAAVTSIGASSPTTRVAPDGSAPRGATITSSGGGARDSHPTIAGSGARHGALRPHRPNPSRAVPRPKTTARGDVISPGAAGDAPSTPPPAADRPSASTPASQPTSGEPTAATGLPVSAPSLPVTTPSLPVSSPSLPVTRPSLPVTTPALPATTTSLPAATPQLPTVTVTAPTLAAVPSLP